MRRALVALVGFALAACSTVIGVSRDVVETGVDASDAADEGDAATQDASDV